MLPFGSGWNWKIQDERKGTLLLKKLAVLLSILTNLLSISVCVCVRERARERERERERERDRDEQRVKF